VAQAKRATFSKPLARITQSLAVPDLPHWKVDTSTLHPLGFPLQPTNWASTLLAVLPFLLLAKQTNLQLVAWEPAFQQLRPIKAKPVPLSCGSQTLMQVLRVVCSTGLRPKA
jgi:hypothetical protein